MGNRNTTKKLLVGAGVVLGTAVPVAAVLSWSLPLLSFVTDGEGVPIENGVIRTYGKVADLTAGKRPWDQNIVTGNTFTSTDTAAASWSIYRSEVQGQDKFVIDEETKEKIWTEESTASQRLYKGLKIQLGDQDIIGDTAEDLKEAIKNSPGQDTIRLISDGTVNYATVKDGEVVDSGVTFHAKDLLHGLKRNLFAYRKFRTSGIVDGVEIDQKYVEKFTDEQSDRWIALFSENYDAADIAKLRDSVANAKGPYEKALLDAGIDLSNEDDSKNFDTWWKLRKIVVTPEPKTLERQKYAELLRLNPKFDLGGDILSNIEDYLLKSEEYNEILDSANSYENKNSYLLGLYGLDLNATFEANENILDKDEFVLKFDPKKLVPASVELLSDNSSLNPFPEQLLNMDSGENGADKYSVFTYGNPYKGSGKVESEGIYYLSPYVYRSLSTSPGTARTVIKNPVYADQDWVKDPNTINGYQIIARKSVEDSNAYIQQRSQAFSRSSVTNEYILDLDAAGQSTTADEQIEYRIYSLPSEDGQSNSTRLWWNFYGFNDSNWNSKGLQMMWGHETIDEIKTSSNAMTHFFSGDGAKLREVIASSVNWYTIAQNLFPGSNKEFYTAPGLPKTFEDSGVDVSRSHPSYLTSIDELKSIYNNNASDRNIQLRAANDVFEKARVTIEALADKVGATSSNKAVVPIFTYLFDDKPGTDIEKKTKQDILDVLNTLTDKVEFVTQENELAGWKVFINRANTQKIAATSIGGFGPDYSGLGSVNQQYLENYVTSGFLAFIKDAINNSVPNGIVPNGLIPEIDDLTEVYESIRNEISSNADYTDHLTSERVGDITIQDLYSYNTNSSDPSLTKDDSDTLAAAQKLLLLWSFKNTLVPTTMSGLQTWINNAALATLSSQFSGRGPYKGDSSQGEVRYYRGDVLDLKYSSSLGGYDLVSSRFKD